MKPIRIANTCLLASLLAGACERVVGFDTATIRSEKSDAQNSEKLDAQDAPAPNCDQVAPLAAGQAQTPLVIPRAPAALSLAFPPSADWCRAPRVPIEKPETSSVTKSSFRAMWSPEALWMLITWQDDRWFTTNFFGYNNDGFYVLLDANASADSELQGDDAQISVVVGSRETSSVTEGAPNHSFPTADIKFEMNGDTITWLLRLPWSEMQSPMAIVDQAIGLDVGVRDTDGQNSTSVTWWHDPKVNYREPRSWGAAVLR